MKEKSKYKPYADKKKTEEQVLGLLYASNQTPVQLTDQFITKRNKTAKSSYMSNTADIS